MKSEINNYFKIENIAALTEAEIDDINIIKKFLLTKFEELGIDFDYETRYIKKTGLKYPMFIPKSLNSYITNEYILLSVKKYTYWCQVIYQLSHELTHCLIYCHNKKEQQKAKWIEETICEAMSLYFLKLFFKQWTDCELSTKNATYKESINNYLNDILTQEGTNQLSNCQNIIELYVINKVCDQKRRDRHNEMKQLYSIIQKEDIIGLIQYKDYIQWNTIVLNTKQYKEAYPDNKAVSYLCHLQDNILNESNSTVIR